MSNKIETYGPPRAHAPQRVRTAESSGAAGSSAPAAAASGDSLKLTGDAVLLQKLERAVAEAPDFDGGRVAELRLALSQGSYKVDPEAIAARLVRMEWELGSRP